MCLASAACCCVSGLCSIASCCGNASKMGRRAARLVYAFLYFLAGLLALLLKYFGGKINVTFFIQVGCYDPSQNGTDPSGVTVSPWIPNTGQSYLAPCAGSQAVYRISFGMLSFFFVCGIFASVIKPFQHGWWFIKILLYLAALVYPFFLPAYVFDGYQQGARWFAGLFLIFQMITYIASAYGLHEAIMTRSEEFTEQQSRDGDEDSKCTCINCWTVLYLFLCVAGIGGILAGIVLMFMNFPCFLPNFMTSVTLVIAFVICLLCTLSRFARGLLTGVVISCYITYLCWSALTSNPDATVLENNKTCNPFLCDPTDPNATCSVGTMVVGILFTIASITYAGFSLGENASKDEGEAGSEGHKNKKKDKSKKIEDEDDKATPLSRDLEKDGSINKQAAKDATEAARDAAEEDAEHDEGESTCCGCSMSENAANAIFHTVMCLASMYLAMLLTNWATYDPSGIAIAGVGTTSMWIKFVSQWVTVGLFVWTLVAPSCCPDRSFD